ncbi:hypothetical protein R1flu_006650 [Riccia fluitans]|uniref:RNA polymerase II-associated protein 1 C-terminal domain-containing protein n=1 Tax=Riccia fluitans TaxID=41844 RepID=A0ABD1YWM7_9MARC
MLPIASALSSFVIHWTLKVEQTGPSFGDSRVLNCQSSPPPDLGSEEEPSEKKYEKKSEPRSLIGGIVEKGFSTSRSIKVSAPQPKVTPFPVARHRSEGPYLASLSGGYVTSTKGENAEEEAGTGLADFAEPLGRRKDSTNKVTSQWRSIRRPTSNESCEPAIFEKLISDTPSGDSLGTKTMQQVPQNLPQLEIFENSEKGSSTEKLKSDITLLSPVVLEEANRDSRGVAQNEPPKSVGKSVDTTGVNRDDKSVLVRVVSSKQDAPILGNGSKGERESGRKAAGISSLGMDAEEIDKETRKAVFSMSAQEVAEAQAELSERFRPELLEMLRRRGLEKEKQRFAERIPDRVAQEADTSTAEEDTKKSRPPSGNSAEDEARTVSGNERTDKNLIANSSIVRRSQSVADGEAPPSGEPSGSTVETKVTSSDFWTERVEAIRSLRFDLDGTVLSFGPPIGKSEAVPTSPAEGTSVSGQEKALSVVERDILRTEGDPAGLGYTLKEAINLVRSTVPGQRAVALRLIAAVLDKALQGLQIQQSKPASFEDLEEVVDWQAVWAYALGPEAELVLTLRLALDDGHSTVVAACARAIQALLSYSANERFFDSLEGLWPGDKFVYTGPIFRRKTKHDEGFIGSGRWKYNVKKNEMFPFSKTSANEEVDEEGPDTVGDDGHVANKDVAAGLVRMGILPRLRYILEVDQLLVADDALLCVLISLARHSPAAAAAVMSCPRLISTVLNRFIFKNVERSEETWSCQFKAIRLLKVLSQASISSCKEFFKCGVLKALLEPLSAKPSEKICGYDESSRGFYSTMIETVRFWRVCLSYRIGLSFFSECYATLCVWLLPLSEEEILEGGPETTFTLSLEAYSLLENIARTLPVLHDKLSPSVAIAVQLDGTRWSWSVAMTMLNTGLKWLSPERIFALHMLLEKYIQGKGDQVYNGLLLKNRVRKILGILDSLLHFLATVCEKIVLEEELERSLTDRSSSSLPWLPTFVPHLGLALTRSGLLNSPRKTSQTEFQNGERDVPTLLDFMRLCASKRDNDSMLAAVKCEHAFVRVSSIVDKLIYLNRPEGVQGPTDQPTAHALLDLGLIASAEEELKKWVTVTGKTMISRCGLIDMSSRGGPAPGVGVGWGSLCGGIFSNHVMLAQASARLNLSLVSVLSRTSSSEDLSLLEHQEVSRSQGQASGDEALEVCFRFDPLWRINTGLALAALATPLNVMLISDGFRATVFHCHCLSLLTEKVEACVSDWSSGDPEGSHHGYGRGRNLLESAHLSKVLVKQLEAFWLTTKRKKPQDSRESRVHPGNKNGSTLSTVLEEEGSIEGDDIIPETLIEEFAGQRLPLPSHWFLSPLMTDIARAMATESGNVSDELEEVVTAGLVFFLGLELLKADISPIGPVIALERKIHALSCVFVMGGDVFLRPLARHLIGALQDIIGREFDKQAQVASEESTNETKERQLQGPHCPNDFSGKMMKLRRLDFESIIDPSYVTYAETIAEQFASSSYGDLVFGRQIALYLCTSVPVNIRLAAWRVLADARVLELLPSLSQCCAQPARYLTPVETDQSMLEAFVSAWSSGALDKAAKRNSLAFRLALHHLGGFIFEKPGFGESNDLLTQKKFARTLVRSTVRNSDRQAMLIRLLVGSPAEGNSGDMKEQVKTRLVFMTDACEGDVLLCTEVQRLHGML